MNQEELEVISIISMRKTEYYYNVMRHLRQQEPSAINATVISSTLKEISKLDNSLFLSDEEKRTRTVNPGLAISELNLDKAEIYRRLLKAVSGPGASTVA